MKTSTAALATLLAVLIPATATAFTVRQDRPRLLLSNGTGPGTSLSTYQQRCTMDSAYMQRCQNGISANGIFPAMSLAAGYVVNGDAARCAQAFTTAQSLASDTPGQPDDHSFISNNGRTIMQLAVVRDWCDPVLSAADKQWLEDRMVSYADWYINVQNLDVYHDDMNNVWAAVAFAGLSLAGTAQDSKAQTYLSAADAQWKNVILPALAYAGDWWHEGFVYVQPAVASAVWYATAWTIATTDDNIFLYAQDNANDLFNGYIDFHAYSTRPDYKYVYFGDTTDNKQSIELFSRYLIDMLTLGTGSAVGQGFSKEILDNSQPGYDYAGADGWMLPLFYDASKAGSATPRDSLPTARWHGQGSNDVAILRSGWGPDDTFVWLSCGDYLGAHQHYEAGSFQIYKKAMLSGATGYYDNFDSDHWQNYYSQHAVHANVLSIHQPGEFFPTVQSLNNPSMNVNDGGQRVLRRDQNGTGYISPDLPTYMSQKTSAPFKETGDIKTFEHASCHDYVACDVTAAYTSPGYETNGNSAKVTEVTRQFIFLRPDILVIFDRVESTDPSYDKRFLLHGTTSPEVSGNQVTITNGAGKLVSQTLLPAQADMNLITNFAVDGVSHPPNPAGAESGGSRVEVSPVQESDRDYFLHVLDTTDPTATATVTEDADNVDLTVDDGGMVTTLRLTKKGDLGGHITVQSGTMVVCDQDLGEFASGTGGSGGGSSSSGATGGANGAAKPGDDSGCGCRVAGQQRDDWAKWAALSLAALGWSGRRRSGKTRKC